MTAPPEMAPQSAEGLRRPPPLDHDAQHRLLQHIIECGDLIEHERTDGSASGMWLLVPLTVEQVEMLAVFDADREDIEDNHDSEPEPDDDLTLPETFDQEQRLAVANQSDDLEGSDGDEEPSAVLPDSWQHPYPSS